MPVLAIGPDERAAITSLKALAADNLVDPRDSPAIEDPVAMKAWRARMNKQTIELPKGYFVTYSHERQPFGRAQHISVSVDRPGKLPSHEAVALILEAFDMPPLPAADAVWIERVSDAIQAVNVVVCRTGDA